MPANHPLTSVGVVRFAYVAYLLIAQVVGAADPVASNARATQLPDRTVEVLYDLAGAPAGGATVSIVLSQDGGATYTITPAAGTLSGDLVGVTSGTNRRIVWSAAAQMPAQFFSTTMKAAITAVDPGGGGDEITITLPGGVPLVLVKIPAGTFQMGAPAAERGSYDWEKPQHEVTLSQAYYLGKTELTQGQWGAVMGTPMPTPCESYGVGDSYPVYCVSWNDICGGATGSTCTSTSFIGKVNTLLGSTKFRLPTEAEWERAARGGTTTEFSFPVPANWELGCGSFPEATSYMWWCGNNTPGGSKPVGTKQANPYGLHDMHGNVWEWVGDWYGSYSSAPVEDPPGPTTGSGRVIRGGSWFNYAQYCRSANRHDIYPGDRFNNLGLRLARSL